MVKVSNITNGPAPSPQRALIVASDVARSFRISRMLAPRARDRRRARIEWASTQEDALAQLRYGEFDICFLDASFDPRGPEILIGRARRNGYHGVWLVLSDRDDADLDLAAMNAGAHAFLLEDELTPERLERSVRYAIALQRRVVALQEQAQRDPLTGLLNLRAFEERLDAAVARSRRQCAPLALLYIDLDGFKAINDRRGHDAGNSLLVAIADRLRARLRRGDTLARVGGDEFAVVLENLPEGASTATSVANALIDTVSLPHRFGDTLLRVGASVGIALSPADAPKATQLMQCADSAMYVAKAAGGGSWARYRSLERGITARWQQISVGRSLDEAG